MAYKKSKEGFTLTEVLLAIAIVGVIAVLVLPATISKFHSELLSQHSKRETQAIKSAVDQLVVTENKANFGETMMYAGLDADMDETAGKFLKKYFNVAKYYGSADTNAETIKSECFASSYYEYTNNEKKVFNIGNDLVGACAKLKNGVSLCIQPQIGQNSIQGVMDLNGPKGPNIKGRDYITFSIDPVKFSSFDLLSKATTEVTNQANPNLQPDPENPCDIGDFSTPCCTYYMNKGVIDSGHDCCDNPEIRPLVPACASDIVLDLNLYPTSTN
ncbi:MAG: prepilin-type N-terminal cleavage/methylation domain-containing protein, partial [Candidatus Gastranaerophilales bacterium]|nr:prepilin-type N-terminal cleavage/methylation domain-containing protein [Candidatus Gastranaerophilales bacterium]